MLIIFNLKDEKHWDEDILAVYRAQGARIDMLMQEARAKKEYIKKRDHARMLLQKEADRLRQREEENKEAKRKRLEEEARKEAEEEARKKEEEVRFASFY